jgi:hypothetical protein
VIGERPKISLGEGKPSSSRTKRGSRDAFGRQPSFARTKEKIMNIPASAKAILEAAEGLGVPQDDSFNLVKLLQANNPELSRDDPKYVRGAEAGDFLFRGKERPVLKGDVGFIMQPYAVKEAWLEWLPERAGLVTKHTRIPPEARGERMPSGNLIEYTRYLIFALVDDALHVDTNDIWAMTFRSTGLTALSREFIQPLKLQRIVVDRVSRKAPIFGSKWRVRSKRTRNQEGSWFTYVFEVVVKYPEGLSEEEFQIGYEMSQALADAEPSRQALPSQGRPKIEITSGRAALEPDKTDTGTSPDSSAQASTLSKRRKRRPRAAAGTSSARQAAHAITMA